MIRTSYNPEADAMFVWFGPEGVKSASNEEVSPGIMIPDSDTPDRCSPRGRPPVTYR